MFEYVFKFLLNVFSLCYVINIVTEKHSKKWCVSVCLYFYLCYWIIKIKKTKKNEVFNLNMVKYLKDK
jgi:hypothetical protein